MPRSPPRWKVARSAAMCARWKDHDAYSKALDRVLRDLRIEKVQAVGEEAL